MASIKSVLSSLRPDREDRVIDCVREAGIDVSDWSNWKHGASRASQNPRYCYEWSFIEPGHAVALNLWFSNMRIEGGRIVQRHNFLEGVRNSGKSNWVSRNRKMHRAVSTAYEDGLPVRVIVCDGVMRGRQDPQQRPSSVNARILDPVAWAVSSLDYSTGDVLLTRGVRPGRAAASPQTNKREWYPDEASLPAVHTEGGRKSVIVNAVERDPRARRECLRFFGHRCQVCDLLFEERYGDVGQGFIHVHHIKPLGSSKGPRTVDPTKDLVPVCPNCHAMLHQRTPPLSVTKLRKLLRAGA